MRDGGKIEAAIEVLSDVLTRYQPVKAAMRDWGKRARYAGAQDRAYVSGLVLDTLRRRNSLAHAMGSDTPRALILAGLRYAWDWDLKQVEKALKDPHAPSALTSDERANLLLAPDVTAEAHIQGDYPEWLAPHMRRVFGDETVIEASAMTRRAPVDLRINTLKTSPEKAGQALRTVQATPSDLLVSAYHIPAPEPARRAQSLLSIPAYSKGWVEVQDAGSQIAAAAANIQPGEQVLDYCAGGGGKTLAMAAASQGEGQIYAYDIDGRRLSALIPRLQRSGACNVQLCHPQEPEALEALKGHMDVVFVDAPCSGTGTWRRKPDSKWRLTPKALAKRLEQQSDILRAAADYVKPGGRMVYATCSFLIEEDEDRIEVFLKENVQFSQESAAQAAIQSGMLTAQGAHLVQAGQGASGGVRLTPYKAGTDGFYFATVRRSL